MATKASPFVIEKEKWEARRDHFVEFATFKEEVNAVDHGEFKAGADRAILMASKHDRSSTDRPTALALQRCRRGGKTFMLHALARNLAQIVNEGDAELNLKPYEVRGKDVKLSKDMQVIFITLSDCFRFDGAVEDAMQAILSRIAYEYSPEACYMYECIKEGRPFDDFRKMYSDFNAVKRWVEAHNVILIVDKLNGILPTTDKYREMSQFLDDLVGREGSALIYSTHVRDTKDLLRGRHPTQGGNKEKFLSLREHEWLMIPRIENEHCLRGMSEVTENLEFWSAVMRGRVPPLMLQGQSNIEKFGQGIFDGKTTVQERVEALAAVITGDISKLPKDRHLFSAYSYMAERACHDDDLNREPRFAWPPFLTSQECVLGKNYCELRTRLEKPDLDEAKAFEALTELAVLVRLLTGEHHELVPHHSSISEDGGENYYKATDMIHVHAECEDIQAVLKTVTRVYNKNGNGHVMQVVAVPMFASFPTYDFFVLHRVNKSNWKVAAGYQCKNGSDYPTVDASKSSNVPLSVWLEGKCRKYRVGANYSGSNNKEPCKKAGWLMLAESEQTDMLGVSVSEALPSASNSTATECSAEMKRVQDEVDVECSQEPSRPVLPSTNRKRPRASDEDE